jgi:hypothetical protein
MLLAEFSKFVLAFAAAAFQSSEFFYASKALLCEYVSHKTL